MSDRKSDGAFGAQEVRADLAGLLYEDFRQRSLRGEKPSSDDLADRFARYRDSVADLLSDAAPLPSVSSQASGSTAKLGLPGVGEEVFGFRLRRELGRGAFARVFLAQQINLADRPVVLKVSGLDGDEPQTLAQMQHTNIVPIHSVHDDARSGLRAVCMPYFGGASLACVLKALWAKSALPAHGSELIETLKSVDTSATTAVASGAVEKPAAAAPCLPGAEPTPLRLLQAKNYLHSCAWILARLAEGLQHAHQRGVLHRDLKPSNILLTTDGQPMLLDFNLAHNVKSDAAAASLGGTVAYMAPEHLRALAGRSSTLAALVDQRADIYSLGMILFEMVVGRSPFDQSASYAPLPAIIEAMAVERSHSVPSLRQCRPNVPWSLESILRKCLTPDPARRYQQAEHLAEDLRRFLDHRPLRHAPELSRIERVQKWFRRHPRLTSSGSVATAALALLLVLAGSLIAVRARLDSAAARERKQAFEQGTVRALCLVNTVTDLHDHLCKGLSTCEETLAQYGILDRDDWQDQPDWQRLGSEDRARLADDARELLLLTTWARVRLAPDDRDVGEQALSLLDRAEAIRVLKPSPALLTDKALYLTRLGQSEAAQTAREESQRLQPASARDHYLLATAQVRNGAGDRYARAIDHLNHAIRLNPQHYWSLIQRGICHQELGEHTLALRDFAACAGLWPEFAWGFFNRATALDHCGKKAEAIADYGAAIERDREFLPAYLNRGLACLELQRYQDALDDFDRLAEFGQNDAVVNAGRGVALEGLKRPGEADAAFAIAFAQLQDARADVRTRIQWVYGFAVAARLPDRARQAFDDVLRQDPRQPQALYGQALLAMGRDQPETLSFFNRALEVSPGFAEARRFRAIWLARQGRFDESGQDVNRCLQQEPQSSANLYAAACVAALAAQKCSQPAAARTNADQALSLLKKAVDQGYPVSAAAQDPDLDGIREHPMFHQLLKRVDGPALGY